MRLSSFLFVLVVLGIFPAVGHAQQGDVQKGHAERSKASVAPRPWRVHDALGGAPWWDIQLGHRVRGEALWNQFRIGLAGDDLALFLQTRLLGKLHIGPFLAVWEMLDARMYFGDDDTPRDTTMVNTFALLQGHVGLSSKNVFSKGDEASIKIGRLTLDVGSRRLVARNNFRNTINTFTGIEGVWTRAEGERFQMALVLPVVRLPVEYQELQRNGTAWDDDSFQRLMMVAHARSRPWGAGLRADAAVIALAEDDTETIPTRNRRLITVDVRLQREKAVGQWDFELEGAFQGGSSQRSLSPSDQRGLRHEAFFVHTTVGYTVEVPWSPRLLAQFDYASGDADPSDADEERFDTLYGARRFEFGPTGMYGAFARSNFNSVELRTELRPSRSFDGFFAVRPGWLAQRRDAWITTGLLDVTGESGSFLGTQLEGRVRWKIFPDNLELELGLATLLLGRFPKEAPGATNRADPLYAYLQLGCEI